MRAVVVGAGPGGLAAALALRQSGVDAHVFERAHSIEQIHVGSGIHIWPNGMRALRAVGAEDAMREVGVKEHRLEIRHRDGDVLGHVAVDALEEKLGASTIGLKRGDMLRVLYERLPADAITLGAACTGYENRNGTAVALFDGGREEVADVVVGADGMYSAIRRQMLGDQPVRHGGYAVYTAYVSSDDESIPRGVLHQVWGRGARFIFYRLHGSTVAWFAIVTVDPGTRETEQEQKQRLTATYRGWFGAIPALVEAASPEEILRIDVADRDPATGWSDGAVTLLGDAAHAITMNIGQGAALAIEDGVVLARTLQQESSVADALRAYETERAARTTEIVQMSRRVGKMGLWRNPVVCAIRNRLMLGLFGPAVQKRSERMMTWEPGA